MSKNTLIGAMLATTVALSALVGCKAPSPVAPGGAANPPAGTQVGQKPGTVAAPSMTGPAATKQQAAAQNGAEIASAMSEEREAEDYNALAEEGASRYNIYAVGGPKAKPGEVAITGGATAEADATATTDAKVGKAGLKGKLKAEVKAKLEARLTKLADKRKTRLAKHKDGAKVKDAAAKAKWVDNGDGTQTKTIEFDVTKTANAKTMTRHRKMVRTVNIEDKALVKLSVEFSHTSPNGASHAMTRTKTLNEDGSYTVVFHSEIKHKDGSSRVADWTKTISAEGGVTGTGKIEWKDAAGAVKKTSAITLGGNEEEETATSTEGGTTTTVEAPIDGEIEAEVKDETGATVEVELTEAEDGTVESSTEATADATASPAASPAASESPAAAASPAASESPAASPAASESPAAAESPAASPAASASPAA